MENRELVIDDKTYKHVKTRHYSPIAVYKFNSEFLRIGPRADLYKEAEFHRNLLNLGFPVPTILRDGEKDNQYYYVESSFGDKHLGDIFGDDVKEGGVISDKNFNSLLKVAKKYAVAQLKTTTNENHFDDFFKMLHEGYILEELPQLADKTKEALAMVKERLKVFPFVLSHGDFNPHNLFPGGVIDLERFSYSPAGYDLLTCIYHFTMFPKAGDFEFLGAYGFTKEQIAKYLSEIDTIYLKDGLPSPSVYKDDFIFSRAIWSTVRMERFPKTQRFRYDIYERMLDVYLRGNDLDPILITKN